MPKTIDRWTSVCLACVCGRMWSSVASQVALSAPCLTYAPSSEAVKGVGISEAYLNIGPLGSTQRHLVAPQTALQCWLTLAVLFREAHNGDIFTQRCILQEDKMHSTEVTMYWTPWLFSPAHTSIFTSTWLRQSSSVSPRTTAVCNWGDKEKRDKLSPAGEHSLWSTEEDESKRKACLTEPWLACWTTHKGTQGIDQRGRPPQKQPGGRRNLLLHSQIYFWRDKRSKDKSRLHWCDHCLSSVMPHDVHTCLNLSLAYVL